MSKDTASQLEAAAAEAESSGLDPLVTVRVLVAEVRKAAADIRATVVSVEDAPKPRKGK
jgi:hypothetical protein